MSDDDDKPASDEPDRPHSGTEADERVPTAAARLTSSLVDAFVAAVLVNLLYLVVAYGVFHPAAGVKLTASQQRSTALIAALLAAVAFVLMHRLAGYTLGNRVSRTLLVGPDGQVPSWGRLAAKYLLIFALTQLNLGLVLVIVCIVVAAWQRQRRNVFDQLTGLRPTISTGPAFGQG